jgi:hypothetical protein
MSDNPPNNGSNLPGCSGIALVLALVSLIFALVLKEKK